MGRLHTPRLPLPPPSDSSESQTSHRAVSQSHAPTSSYTHHRASGQSLAHPSYIVRNLTSSALCAASALALAMAAHHATYLLPTRRSSVDGNLNRRRVTARVPNQQPTKCGTPTMRAISRTNTDQLSRRTRSRRLRPTTIAETPQFARPLSNVPLIRPPACYRPGSHRHG